MPLFVCLMSDPSAQLHGTGGLLATPGMGSRARRKGRRWGMRTKDKQIVGNLYRSNTGKFTAGGSPSDAPPRFGKVPKKPKIARGRKQAAKPKKVAQTPDEKRASRATEQAQNRGKVLSGLNIAPDGQAALEALRSGAQPDPQAIERGGFEQAGLVERATDGSYRMTASGRAAMAAAAAGDAGRAGSIISSARDRLGARSERTTAAQTRREQVQARREAAAKKKQGIRTKQTAEDRAMFANMGGGGGGSGGSGGKPSGGVGGLYPKGPSGKRTPQAAASSGGSGAQDGKGDSSERKPSIEDGKGHEWQAADVHAIAKGGGQEFLAFKKANGNAVVISTNVKPGKHNVIVWKPNMPNQEHKVTTSQLKNLLSDMHGKGYQSVKKIKAPKTEPKPAAKSFTVYKDATGAHRWIARTTTAYRDRDGEIISEAALDADSQRMTTTKQFGPLRYWHVGQPDPFDEQKPWGPGLDIGDCDYSVVIGRTRIESGTFRNPAIAQKMAAAADRHEMSPGFFHPLDQPDSGGVFNSIRTFERSSVPKRYGRASNLFTGFTVKEFRMDLTEMERRFKAMYSELGLTPEQGVELGQSLIATEKDATAQGIAFKESDLPDLEINGVVYKAFPPSPPKADDEPPVEEDAEPVEAMAEEVIEPDAEMAGDYLGDMSWEEFAGKLSELLAPVLKMQDMVKAMGDAHAELKGMYGGVAQKDDARAAELTTLKSSLAELTAKIEYIEGRQPANILVDQVEAALKSEGPSKPVAPENPTIHAALNDPTRPFAALGIHTWPGIYENGENT